MFRGRFGIPLVSVWTYPGTIPYLHQSTVDVERTSGAVCKDSNESFFSRSSCAIRSLSLPISSACSTTRSNNLSLFPLSTTNEGLVDSKLFGSPLPVISQSMLICSQNENTRGKSIELRVRQFESVAFFIPNVSASSLSVPTANAALSLFSMSSEEKVFIL